METILDQMLSFTVENYREIQALAGLLLFSAATKYSYRIVKNLDEHEDYSLTKLFIDRRATVSFWVISVSALILSFGMALQNMGRRSGNDLLISIGLMSTVLMMLGIAYFSSLMYRITSQQMEDEE